MAGDGVNHHRGAAVAENRVAVGAQRDVGRDDRGVSGAVGTHDQREIRNVTGGQRAVVVRSAIGIEMRPGGLEVGSFALGELMDVERVFAGRKVFDVEFDPYSVGSIGERSGADDLILGVFNVYDQRLGWRRRGGVDDSRRKEKAENG